MLVKEAGLLNDLNPWNTERRTKRKLKKDPSLLGDKKEQLKNEIKNWFSSQLKPQIDTISKATGLNYNAQRAIARLNQIITTFTQPVSTPENTPIGENTGTSAAAPGATAGAPLPTGGAGGGMGAGGKTPTAPAASVPASGETQIKTIDDARNYLEKTFPKKLQEIYYIIAEATGVKDTTTSGHDPLYNTYDGMMKESVAAVQKIVKTYLQSTKLHAPGEEQQEQKVLLKVPVDKEEEQEEQKIVLKVPEDNYDIKEIK
jgi:hypothetical protein